MSLPHAEPNPISEHLAPQPSKRAAHQFRTEFCKAVTENFIFITSLVSIFYRVFTAPGVGGRRDILSLEEEL